MKIVITGGNGFIGKNLAVRLREIGSSPIIVDRQADGVLLAEALVHADAVVHLAGVNRPKHEREFATGNAGFTETLCEALKRAGRPLPVLFASSARVADDTPYGRSKAEAEKTLLDYAREANARVAIFRLPNVFGKWCRPDYNSAVATFCNNIATGLPITINDPSSPLSLAYVDDVVDAFIGLLKTQDWPTGRREVAPVYTTSVGAVADMLNGFKAKSVANTVDIVGTGLQRALYATYVTYLPRSAFSYPLKKHEDPRGSFSEFVKTETSGQVSVFTAHPGVTRGGHYHHTKTEKFLIIQGHALFRFRHILTDEVHEIATSGDVPTVVETIPGWSHSVENVGDDLLICCLWANELFDPARPDTITAKV